MMGLVAVKRCGRVGKGRRLGALAGSEWAMDVTQGACWGWTDEAGWHMMGYGR